MQPRQEKRCIIAAALIALAALTADQITKWYVERFFALYESRPVIPDWLSWTSVRNLGAAWSMFSGYGWVLFIFGIAVSLAILWYFRKLADGYAERYFALALAVSGIWGNSIDRLFRGAVVDFIDVHYKTVWRYPVFNVADMAICIGIGIYVLSNLLRKPKKDEGK